MIIFFLCIIFTRDIIEYRGTNVFQPLKRGEVRTDQEGNLFVLAFSEGLITIYQHDGKLLSQIGGKGDGPGELNYPVDFWVVDNRIYVFDIQNAKISMFDTKGEFLERWAAPRRSVKLAKVKGGWFYGDWGSFAFGEPSKAVMWSDDKFEAKKVVCEVDDLGFSVGLRTQHTETGRRGIYSPISNRPFLIVAEDAKTAYLTDTKTFRIRILGAEQRKVIGVIDKSVKLLPFDKEWAKKKFLQEVDEKMRARYKWKKNIPEFFPAIKSLILSEDGDLIIDQWRGKPDKYNHYVTLSPTGAVLSKEWDSDYLARIVGRFGDYLYVSTWNDKAQEARVIRLPREKARDFIKNNPIKFEGFIGRRIGISL